ncbi:MAG: glycosyltransferase family 2 protein, partial [Bacilli bacterium]|nr:glycosyltransferase family 2 protein [Bacilli bacterium]
MKNDVSIIVPIYNAEKYLKKCVDSLVNQTKKELEIILINDGSTDNTL